MFFYFLFNIEKIILLLVFRVFDEKLKKVLHNITYLFKSQRSENVHVKNDFTQNGFAFILKHFISKLM